MEIKYLKGLVKEKGLDMKYYFRGDEDFIWENESFVTKLNYEDFLDDSEIAIKKIIKSLILANDLKLKEVDKEVDKIYKENPGFKTEVLDIISSSPSWKHHWDKVKLHRKKDKGLENLMEDIVPIIKPLTEDYFGEEFIDNFVEKYHMMDAPCSAALISGSSEGKYDIVLSLKEDQFDGNKISGYGVFNVIHEFTHLHHYQKFGEDQDLDYNLMESHCDLSAYEILLSSESPKLAKAIQYAKENHLEKLSFENPRKNILKTRELVLAYRYLNKEKDLGKRDLIVKTKGGFEEYLKDNSSLDIKI